MLESRRDGSLQSLYVNNAGRSGRRACGKSGGELRERVLLETGNPEKAGWRLHPRLLRLGKTVIFREAAECAHWDISKESLERAFNE